jgi:hypothetical protein
MRNLDKTCVPFTKLKVRNDAFSYARPTRSEIERFLKKCSSGISSLASPNTCIEWNGYVDKGGTAIFYFHKMRMSAQRLVYIWFIDNPLKKQKIRSNCGTELCMNPHHLEANIITKKKKVPRNLTKEYWKEWSDNALYKEEYDKIIEAGIADEFAEEEIMDIERPRMGVRYQIAMRLYFAYQRKCEDSFSYDHRNYKGRIVTRVSLLDPAHVMQCYKSIHKEIQLQRTYGTPSPPTPYPLLYHTTTSITTTSSPYSEFSVSSIHSVEESEDDASYIRDSPTSNLETEKLGVG